jgi:predicted membrane protein (TIGR00267 family)
MRSKGGLFGQDKLLPAVLGFSDGILTALTLAAGRLTSDGRPMTFSLALRLAMAALASGAFVFFVARYAELRRELIRAERQLNITTHGQLATSHLGKTVFWEGVAAAVISSLAAFLGALTPLTVAAVFPRHGWVSILTALVSLALLGVGLARVVHGRVLHWAVGLVLGGGVLSVIGAYLRIVG